MMKKLVLLTLIPMTLTLQGAFVMKKGQHLTKIEQSPENVKPDVEIKPVTTNLEILTIGDSFTDGSDILKPLKSKLDKTKLEVSFIGTESDAGIHHEGRGGWTAAAYMNLNPSWYPNSPFLNNGKIDFKNYFKNTLKTQPNVIIIQLGVNDMLGATKGIKKGYFGNDIIQKKVDHISLLAQGIRNALPASSKILMLMPTPPSSTYPGSLSGVNHQQYSEVFQQYNKHYLSKFKNRESEGIYVVAENLSIHTGKDYKDYVHPNTQGYAKIAEALKVKLLSIISY